MECVVDSFAFNFKAEGDLGTHLALFRHFTNELKETRDKGTCLSYIISRQNSRYILSINYVPGIP